jgi:tRNA (guanine37-N1)-methyltransferase
MKLKEALRTKLTEKEIALVPSSFDVVGDIAIFAEMPKGLSKKESIIAKTLMGLHKNLKVVCKKTKKYSGKFRTPKLKIIAGEKRKHTVHKENGIFVELDVEKVYFSARLGTERKRIYSQIKDGENVLVMFSGCGIYPITISKNTKAKQVYGIEINPVAHEYAKKNVIKNKCQNVQVFLGDVKKVVPKLKKKFDRICMPLPKDASLYLDSALSCAKRGCIIHLYSFIDVDGIENEKKNIERFMDQKRYVINGIYQCGQFSPSVYRYCFDIKVNI